MSNNTDRAWKAWGEKDPYYGVLSDERFHVDRIEQSRDAFFKSGEEHIEQVLSDYERLFGTLPKSSALDFGCGVGRLTLPLARRFESVVGLDVSPAMLQEAGRNAALLAVSNAAFLESDDLLSRAEGQFDFVNTFIVLQHIPVSRGLPILDKLIDKVRPGGGCMLHMSIRRPTTARKRLAYWIRFHVPFGGSVLNVLAGRPIGIPGMQMNEYPLSEVLESFHLAGMPDVWVNLSDHNGVLTASLTAMRRPTEEHGKK